MGTKSELMLSFINIVDAFVIPIATLMLWQLQKTNTTYRIPSTNKIIDIASKLSELFYT